MLVAPVWQADKTEWQVYLPEGSWVHLWTGKTYGKGEHTVPAPLGHPPGVLPERDSPWAAVLEDPLPLRRVTLVE